MGEVERAPGIEERTELIGAEKLVQPGAAGQHQLGRGAVAARDGHELPGGQRLAYRVEQRAEHRARREMPHVEGQGPPSVRREQGVRPQFQEHAGEQPGGLAHQGLVRRIVLRDVGAGRGRAVRTLDQEPRNVSFSVGKNTVSGTRPHAAI